MVRHEVAGRPRRRHPHQVSDLVRAAALLRADARALAEGRALPRRARRGSPSSTRSSTSSITSIRPSPGLRQFVRADGSDSMRSHGPHFYEDVAEMVKAYLASDPDPALYEFLKCDFAALEARYGGVVATTFRNFPSFPQRYMERLRRCRSAEQRAGRAAQAADAARALHRRRSPRPPVHRIENDPPLAQRPGTKRPS